MQPGQNVCPPLATKAMCGCCVAIFDMILYLKKKKKIYIYISLIYLYNAMVSLSFTLIKSFEEAIYENGQDKK